MSKNLADSHLISSASAHWYPITVFSTLLLLLGVIPFAMLSLADHGPTDRTSGSARFIYFMGKQKQKISDQTQGRRLVLVGGSGAFYSVRAKTLQARFGIPVINNALHAGLGIDYLLYRARQSLRPGDTVILFLEYAHYLKRPSAWTQADYFLPYDLRYFTDQPLKTQIELIEKLSPGEYGDRVYDAAFAKPINGKHILDLMNGHGDLVKNKLASQSDSHRTKLDEHVAMRNMVFRQEGAGSITDFYRWCQERGISIIAGYPAFLDFPEYHSGVEMEFFKSLGNYYHSLGVPTLGEPADFMFPKSMFFDTHYHMHDEGAAVMTELVGRRLEPILGITRNSGDSKPGAPI